MNLRRILSPFPLLALLALASAPSLAPASPKAANLPADFYARDGLADMPRIDYAGMRTVNVLAHGAVGDGKTDNRAAFDRAVHALGKAGGVVFIPRGDYYFAQPDYPARICWAPQLDGKPLENVHFVGEGDESAIQLRYRMTGLPVSIYYGWNFGAARNVSVRDLRFSQEPLRHQRWFPGLGAMPLAFERAQDIQVVRTVVDQGDIAIVFWAPAKNIWIVDCQIFNTGADGIHIDNGENTTAAYNYIENCGDDGVAMVGLNTTDPKKAGLTRNNRFLHNTVVGVRWGRGLLLNGENMEARGNHVESLMAHGIFVQNSGHHGEGGPAVVNAFVADNTVIRPNIAGRSDNNLQVSAGAGIQLSGEVRSIKIAGNEVRHGQQSGINLSGINGQTVAIDDNRLLGNLGWGVLIDMGNAKARLDRLALDDNTLAANRQGGLSLSDPRHVIGRVDPASAAERKQSAAAPVPEDPYAVVRAVKDDVQWLPEPAPAPQDLTEVNLRDFGARGDGLADDSSAFVRALEALPAAGGRLRIPAGAYRIAPRAGEDTSPETAVRHALLVQKRRNLHLVGEGPASRLLFSSRDHQGLRFLQVSDSSISDLALTMENPPGYRRNRALIDLSACDGFRLERLSLADSSGPGVLLNASRRVLVSGCEIVRAGTEGVKIAASRQVAVTGNRIRDSRDHGVMVGWFASIALEPQYVRIAGNTIEGSRSGCGIGLCSGNEVAAEDNIVRRTPLAGIAIYEQARMFSPRSIRVAGNTVEDCGRDPDNYFRGAVAVSKIFGGRLNATRIEIADNRIRAEGVPAVWVGDNKSINAVVVRGNRVEGAGPQAFVFSDSTVGEATLAGNIVPEARARLDLSDTQRKAIARLDAR